MNCVQRFIVGPAIYIHNIYCDIVAGLGWCYTAILATFVTFAAFLNSKRAQVPKILYAQLDDQDVTLHVGVFYDNDNIISVASMYRWLIHFYPAPKKLTIIFTRNSTVIMSIINLETDFEILTAQEIPNGDIELHMLPGKILGINEPYLDAIPCTQEPK